MFSSANYRLNSPFANLDRYLIRTGTMNILCELTDCVRTSSNPEDVFPMLQHPLLLSTCIGYGVLLARMNSPLANASCCTSARAARSTSAAAAL